MGDRSLVLDANVLIRAVLGQRVRQLIERYSVEVDLFAPDTAFSESEEHLPALCVKRGLPLDKVMAVLQGVSTIVQALPQPIYVGYEIEARARIQQRDPDDWPVVACSLALKCPIWTEDSDFFGAGVATWTTQNVEMYLADKTLT